MSTLKHYVKEVEIADSAIYYNNYDAEADKFWAGGNTDFVEINEDLISGLMDKLTDFSDDCASLEEESSTVDLKEYLKLANYYFPKANGTEITDENLKMLMDTRRKYASHSFVYYDVLCKLLEIIYDEPFQFGTLKGYCQSDWINYICPASVSETKLNYIEAVYFGKGSEYEVSEEAYESLEAFESAGGYTYYIYCAETNPQKIKQHIAEELGCTIDEVSVRRITGTHTVVHYDYEEI